MNTFQGPGPAAQEAERGLVVQTLKALLRQRGMTYADVATALGLSLPTIKRQFSKGHWEMERLAEVSSLVGLSLTELFVMAQGRRQTLERLSLAQEHQLVDSPRLLLVASLVLNGYDLEAIVRDYDITQAEGIKHLLALERLGFLTLGFENKIRLLVTPTFDWQPGGPIETFFRRELQGDFLDSDFSSPQERRHFVFALLDDDANQRLQTEMRRWVARFRQEHGGISPERSKRKGGRPNDNLRGTCMMVAMRPWEPAAFRALKKAPEDS